VQTDSQTLAETHFLFISFVAFNELTMLCDDSEKGIKINYFLLRYWSALWKAAKKPSACYFDVSVMD